MPTDIYAGLGSNVDPARHLNDAIGELRRRYGQVKLSPIYRNPAVGFDGDDFLNTVIRIRCEDAPDALQRAFSAMERAVGRRKSDRERAIVFGPRTLDLDLLLHGSMVDPEAGLPRSDILRYAFVLRPLAELAAELVHPLTGRTMTSHWRAVEARSPPMHECRI